MRQIYDFLQWTIEVSSVIIIVVSCRGISLDDGGLKGDAFRRMVVSRLGTGRHPMMAFSVFVNEVSNSMLMSVFTATMAFWDRRFSIFFQLTSRSPRMFNRYLLTSCDGSSSFPAALSNLKFQVPIAMLIHMHIKIRTWLGNASS